MIARRDFPGRRWLGIGLRTLHLIGVVLAGAAILGAIPPSMAGIALMLLSGLALYAIDLWHHPAVWREVAGAFVLFKLAVLSAMWLVPQLAAGLFWLLLVSSSLVSHAPRTFRHRRILG